MLDVLSSHQSPHVAMARMVRMEGRARGGGSSFFRCTTVPLDGIMSPSPPCFSVSRKLLPVVGDTKSVQASYAEQNRRRECASMIREGPMVEAISTSPPCWKS